MKKNKNRKINNWDKIVTRFVLLALTLSTIFVLIMLIFPTNRVVNGEIIKTRSDYVLMLIQCVLGIAAVFLPSILEKKWKLEIPSSMEILYVVFLYCAIILGEVRNFYYTFSHWDTILHIFSGGMLGALGFSVVSIMNKSKRWHLNLRPSFVAFFAFCFAITLGVAWEIYEFSFDGLLGLNMQKFALENGTELIGRFALKDTMKDLIVDALGEFVVSLIGFIYLKYKKGWLKKIIIHNYK